MSRISSQLVKCETHHSQHGKEDDHSQAGVGSVRACVDVWVPLLIQLQHAQPGNHVHERSVWKRSGTCAPVKGIFADCCSLQLRIIKTSTTVLENLNVQTPRNAFNVWKYQKTGSSFLISKRVRSVAIHGWSHQIGSWCSWDRRGNKHSASPPSSAPFPWHRKDQSALEYHIPGEKPCRYSDSLK